MKKPTEKQMKEYDEYMNEQFRILRNHADRCFQRCINKLYKMMGDGEWV